MISLRQLRYLSALAQHRHFGRAAAACAVTQPALSMQLRELETRLGAELIERRPGEVRFTEIGREIVRRGEWVLAGVRDLEAFAKHSGRLLVGRLQLGVIPSLGPYVLPQVLPLLHARHPDLRLELRETQTKVLLDELTRGTLDAALLALPVSGEFETMPLFRDAFLLAVPASDPRPQTQRVRIDEIERGRLILLEEGHCLRDQALALCNPLPGEAPLTLGATSLATVVQLVANDYGVTLLPELAASVEARDGRIKLLRFATPEPGRTVGLAWRRSLPRQEDFQALGELITGAVGAGKMSKRPRLDASAIA